MSDTELTYGDFPLVCNVCKKDIAKRLEPEWIQLTILEEGQVVTSFMCSLLCLYELVEVALSLPREAKV